MTAANGASFMVTAVFMVFTFVNAAVRTGLSVTVMMGDREIDFIFPFSRKYACIEYFSSDPAYAIRAEPFLGGDDSLIIYKTGYLYLFEEPCLARLLAHRTELFLSIPAVCPACFMIFEFADRLFNNF